MDRSTKTVDFIFITTTRWDEVSSTSYSLAQEFSKTNRVFLFDKPYTWNDVLFKRTKSIKFRLKSYLFGKDRFRKLEGLPEKFTLVIPEPDVPVNFLSKGWLYNLIRRYNQKKIERIIRKTCKQHSIKNYILFNSFNPSYSLNVAADIRPQIKLYQSVDNMSYAPYLAKHGAYLELEVVPEADVLLGTSKEIVNKFTSLGYKILYLPNAANIESFKAKYFESTERPDEFKGITKPIVGYIGSLDHRFDVELLVKLLEACPENMIVLLGPTRIPLAELLAKYPNLMHIGFKPMKELPLYAKYMDCTIIPFKRTGFTKSVYPLKINEYLGAGRPAVTTNFSDDMDDFSSIAFISRDHEDFISSVKRALKENTKEKELERISFAENNSWGKRTEQFWELLKTHYPEKWQKISM